MNTRYSLGLVSLSCLPLLVLTVRAFTAPPSPRPVDELVTYDRGSRELKDAETLLASPIASGTLTRGDPAGWTRPKKAKADEEQIEYQLALGLERADRALSDRDVRASAEVASAIVLTEKLLSDATRAKIESLEPAGKSLMTAVELRSERLKRRKSWLENRSQIGDVVKRASGLLVGEPSGEKEQQCIDLTLSTKERFPRVVPDDSEEESSDSRTSTENAALKALYDRANFRLLFHTAMTDSDPKPAFEKLQALLEKYRVAPDASDGVLLDKANRSLPAFRLAHYRQEVRNAPSVKDFVTAISRLTDDRFYSSPDRRKSIEEDTAGLTKEWLAGRITPAGLPKALTRLGELQEAISTANDQTTRILGVFRKIPKEVNKWRYWQDPKQQNQQNDIGELVFPRGWFPFPLVLERDPGVPELLVLQGRYQRLCKEFLASCDAKAETRSRELFVEECNKVLGVLTKHLALPSSSGDLRHPLQAPYDEWGKELSKTLENAARIVREFDDEVVKAGGVAATSAP